MININNMAQEHRYIAEQSKIKLSISPQELLEKAVSYMTARWLTVGSPNREKLSIDFCNLKPKEQKEGIRVRRVKQKELCAYLRGLDEFNDYKSLIEQIDRGHVPDDFLLPEEHISYNYIKTMEEECGVNPEYYREKGYLTNWQDRWRKIGPLKYKEIECSLVDLPWQIAERVEDEDVKKFFLYLEDYAGHPWGARAYFFNSPAFSSGMGDASAKSNLILFQNGSFAHIVDNGSCWEDPGIYVSTESKINLESKRTSFHSPIAVSSIEEGRRYLIPVRCLERDTIFIKRYYPHIHFFEKGSIISQCGELISDPEKLSEVITIHYGDSPPRQVTYREVVDAVLQLNKPS